MSDIHQETIDTLNQFYDTFIKTGVIELPKYNPKAALHSPSQLKRYFTKIAASLKRPIIIVEHLWNGQVLTFSLKRRVYLAAAKAQLTMGATHIPNRWGLSQYIYHPVLMNENYSSTRFYFQGETGHAILRNFLNVIQTEPSLRKAMRLDK